MMRLCLLLMLLAARPLPAQEVRTAVLPEAITVGDVFHAVIRVNGAGTRGVVFPDSLALPPELELAGRLEIRRDTVSGALRWTAIYPLAGWRPGEFRLPDAEVRLTEGGRTTAATAAFPAFVIRSVLPADTAGIEPKPPKDVLGGNRVWWPIVLLALLVLLAAAALWYAYRRRRAARPVPVVVPVLVDPRERALQALDAAWASGAVEAGDFKAFYSAVSEALREYLAQLDGGLGTELTTTELTHVLRALRREADAAPLGHVLHAADMVKFARRRPTTEAAWEEWQQARTWVEQAEWGRPVEGEEQAA